MTMIGDSSDDKDEQRFLPEKPDMWTHRGYYNADAVERQPLGDALLRRFLQTFATDLPGITAAQSATALIAYTDEAAGCPLLPVPERAAPVARKTNEGHRGSA